VTRPILDLLTRNFGLKVAAFGLALLLWVSVRAERQDRRALPAVPIRVTLDDPEWTLRGDPLPATVEVRLSGPTRSLFQVALERPVLVIPVDRVASADTAVVLSREWLRMGSRPGVTVDDIQPSSVRLSFERVRTSTVPVATRVRGELPDGLVLSGPPIPEPAAVRLLGPVGRVDAMDSVRLVAVDLSRLDWDRPVRVAVDTAGFGRVRVSPDTVTLRFSAESPAERVVSGIVLTVAPDGVPEDLQFDVSAVSVVLRGGRAQVEGVIPGALRAVLDPAALLGLEPGESVEIPVRVEGLPPMVSARTSPEQVTVRRPEPGSAPEPMGVTPELRR
jgi:YbbR domain-containing protein